MSKIHNLTMRELPGGTLFPETMKQYDDYTIREALHNAIAHQDYTLQQRINFVENPGWLVVSFQALCKRHWRPKVRNGISEMNVFAVQW